MTNRRFQIEVANDQDALPIDAAQLREAVASVLYGEGLREAEVSIAIVDDPTIWQLNKLHLQHDYPTDVLSFLLTRDHDYLDGEVIVSADTAIREAASFDWEPQTELLLYVIHGTLHLAGHDDLEDEARATMRQREDHYLVELTGRPGKRNDGGGQP